MDKDKEELIISNSDEHLKFFTIVGKENGLAELAKFNLYGLYLSLINIKLYII